MALVGALAMPASAQTTQSQTQTATSGSSDQALGLAYSIERLSGVTSGAGFTADYDKKVAGVGQNLGLDAAGEFGINHFANGTHEAFRGGVRFEDDATKKLTPFGEFMIGGLHFTGGTDLTFIVGGGANIALAQHGAKSKWLLRVQADIPVTMVTGGHVSGVRFDVGVAIPLGK